MNPILELAEEFEKLQANTAVRLTPYAQRTIVAALRMVNPVDELMAYLGCYGEISRRSVLADTVMNALHEVDPK